MAVGTKPLHTYMVLKGFPNGVTEGQQYNIGEKPTVTLYTYINHHVGTPKPKPLDIFPPDGVCVCVFIKLHITAQSGLVILVILCHSR